MSVREREQYLVRGCARACRCVCVTEARAPTSDEASELRILRSTLTSAHLASEECVNPAAHRLLLEGVDGRLDVDALRRPLLVELVEVFWRRRLELPILVLWREMQGVELEREAWAGAHLVAFGAPHRAHTLKW